MGVISRADYISIADDIACSRLSVLNGTTQLYDAVTTVVLSQDIDVEVDLLMPFWESYQITLSNNTIPTHLLSATSVLQQHIIDNTSYTDINDWLRAENILVPETFAEISEAAGWPIDHDRITNDPTVTCV